MHSGMQWFLTQQGVLQCVGTSLLGKSDLPSWPAHLPPPPSSLVEAITPHLNPLAIESCFSWESVALT